MSDGLELNLSCPHAKSYGMAMGQDPELVREFFPRVVALRRGRVVFDAPPSAVSDADLDGLQLRPVKTEHQAEDL